MSLILCWHYADRAFILSDGLERSDGRVSRRDKKKFFRTAGNVLIGLCGRAHCVADAQREFSVSTEDFSALKPRLSETVRAAHAANPPDSDLGRALGIIVIGREGNTIRSANIGPDGVRLSNSLIPIFHVASAKDEAAPIIEEFVKEHRLLSSVQTAEVPGLLRELAEKLFAEFPDFMGGSVFSDSFSLDDPPLTPAAPRPRIHTAVFGRF